MTQPAPVSLYRAGTAVPRWVLRFEVNGQTVELPCIWLHDVHVALGDGCVDVWPVAPLPPRAAWDGLDDPEDEDEDEDDGTDTLISVNTSTVTGPLHVIGGPTHISLYPRDTPSPSPMILDDYYGATEPDTSATRARIDYWWRFVQQRMRTRP